MLLGSVSIGQGMKRKKNRKPKNVKHVLPMIIFLSLPNSRIWRVKNSSLVLEYEVLSLKGLTVKESEC